MELITRAEAKAQGLKRYFTGKPCKYGHIAKRRLDVGTCDGCKERIYQRGLQLSREHNKKHREEKDKRIKIQERQRELHKEYLRRCKVDNAERKRKNAMPSFIRSTLARVEALTGAKRQSLVEVKLNYTRSEFIEHIESQFADGMSWDDRSAFHIDHIKPLSLFLKEGITDPAIINALSNLQPLWAKDNLSKGAKY